VATPFKWEFTRRDLAKFLRKLKARQSIEMNAA